MLRLVSLSDSGEPFRTPLPASVVAALTRYAAACSTCWSAAGS